MKPKILKLTLAASIAIMMFTGCRANQSPAPNIPQTQNYSTNDNNNYLGINGMSTPNNEVTVDNNNPGGAHQIGMGMGTGGNDTINNRNNVGPMRTDPGDAQFGYDNVRRAQNVESQLDAMNEIDRSAVIIDGNRALVGIAIGDNYKSGQEASIKDSVSQTVKNMLPGVTDVYVSEMPDMFDRIKTLADNARNGTIQGGLSGKFTDIVNSIKPGGR